MTASLCLQSSFDTAFASTPALGGVDFVDDVAAHDAAEAGAPSRARAAPHGPAPSPWLEVFLPAPPWPGSKLREALEAAIEQELDKAGAPAAGVNSLGDLDSSLCDQLYRARRLGAHGLVVHVPDLTRATGPAGALDAEDSAALRWWIGAAAERPVRLVLDAGNRAIGAYGPPTRLELLVGPRVDGPSLRQSLVHDDEAPADSAHGDADAVASADAAAHRDPDAVASADGTAHRDPGLPSGCAWLAASVGRPARRAERGSRKSRRCPRRTPRPSATSGAPPLDEGRGEAHAPRFGRLMVPNLPNLPNLRDASRARVGEQARPEAGAETDPERHSRLVAVFPRREPTHAAAVPGAGPPGPPPAVIDWRAFASDLELARGPKPLAIVERLFMSRYVALLECVARGETDESARRTLEQWAGDFARSYTEGFSALKVTGKRPRMVLDAPQLCNQIARLHGAKSTQLILVDGMRFDVGLRVQERLMHALHNRATCTERLLLWAALPTTTPAQLDLLARGPEGLTSPGPPSDGEELGVRGRTSATLRRVRIGARDLLKLDAVESRLREAGPPLGERLDAMADEVAHALAAHARTQPPRTLMFIFGDHGFRMDSGDVGTCAATSGGASPEEVLVPAFAWLIGDVH